MIPMNTIYNEMGNPLKQILSFGKKLIEKNHERTDSKR